MPYREDEDAALARADALQSDLDRAQAELEATKATLADTARERDLLAKERDALARNRGLGVVRWDFRRNVLPLLMLSAGMVFLGMLVFGVKASHDAEKQTTLRVIEQTVQDAVRSADLGNGPPCTIHTVPEGAEIVTTTRSGRIVTLGVTPFARTVRLTRSATLEARLDGYVPLAITAPRPGNTGECTVTYTLQKQ